MNISLTVAKLKSWRQTLWGNTLLCLVIALVVGVVLDFLWLPLHPPFLIPRVFPAVTAPVDGPFYLHNADYGYSWFAKDLPSLTLSFWFHPLMSWLVAAMPYVLPGSGWLPSNIRFWLISLVFAVGCLILSYRLIEVWGSSNKVSVRLLPLILFVPGGLEIATGNAEIPTLFFTLGLLLSVLRWQRWQLTVVCAVLAILTKPNALYMIPILLVYFIAGCQDHDTALLKQALIGIIVLLVVWLIWVAYVGLRVGEPDIYWKLRELSSQYAAHDWKGFLHQLASSVLYSDDIRDRVRYFTALIISVANLVIIGLIPLAKERDRYALAAGNLAMLGTALLMGNPNKIIVYTTTLPGYFAMHLLFMSRLVTKTSISSSYSRWAAIVIYSAYWFVMLIVYVLGTPLGWYY